MSWLRDVSDRLAAAFGIALGQRESILRGLMAHQAKDAPAYWLQLVLSMGLATLGLALGSTAVVIGAMLVSPLMGPVVALSMGVATGSPFLTIRSFARLASSIVAVVLGSALITLVLPFHEATPQIVSRTHPNALDLAVAVFCAFAAAFTTLRAGAATSATAAGTAVGIALVPPLCVVGYEIGVGRWGSAAGAALLFTANVCAILFFSGLSFLAFGFGALDVRAAERTALAAAPASRPVVRMALWLENLFRGRYSLLLRVLVPLGLVAIVLVPLVRALSQVSAEVRIRAGVEAVLNATPIARQAVRTSIHVDRGTVTAQLVIVGSSEDAGKLEEALLERIKRIHGGVDPHVHVVAVPDVTLVEHAEQARDQPPLVTPPPPTVDDVRRRLGDSLRFHWPAAAAGALLGWRLDLATHDPTHVIVVHLGAALGAAGEALLAQALADVAGSVTILDRPLPSEVREPPADDAKWLGALERAVDGATVASDLHLCVTLPNEASLRRNRHGLEALAATRVQLSRLPSARVMIVEGRHWGLRMALEACSVASD